MGIYLKDNLSYKYLGTDFTGGASKCRRVLMDRYKDTRNRSKRHALFAKRFRGARKFFSGSTYPAMLWGHPISGLTTAQLLEAERAGARCSVIHPAGKCRFVTNYIIYGPKGHPVARILKETFRTWFATLTEVVTTMPDFYPQLRLAWTRSRDSMLETLEANGGDDFSLMYFKHSVLDKHVHGILTNVLSLLSPGLEPQAHRHMGECPWPSLCDWFGQRLYCPLLYDIIESYNALQYERASRHFDGKGIQLGIEWASTLSLTYSMRRSKSQWVTCLLAALETIMAVASWPQSRIGNIFEDATSACVLCGAPIADSHHVLWDCPCINNIDDEAISGTNHLARRANQEVHEYPCYWLRGIMPKPFATNPEDMTGYVDKYYCSYYLTAPPGGAWPSGGYCGDAGGGKHNLYPTLIYTPLLEGLVWAWCR